MSLYLLERLFPCHPLTGTLEVAPRGEPVNTSHLECLSCTVLNATKRTRRACGLAHSIQ